MIDLDECGIELYTTNRSIGKSYLGRRDKQSGLYSKTDKLNLLLAISGDNNIPMRCRDMWTGEGTTGNRMIDFVRRIIEDLATIQVKDHRFCFIMDNLRSHHNQHMLAIIIAVGHRIVFRALYYPVYGPIKYVFNTIQGVLRVLLMPLLFRTKSITPLQLFHHLHLTLSTVDSGYPKYKHLFCI